MFLGYWDTTLFSSIFPEIPGWLAGMNATSLTSNQIDNASNLATHGLTNQHLVSFPTNGTSEAGITIKGGACHAPLMPTSTNAITACITVSYTYPRRASNLLSGTLLTSQPV